MAVDLDRHHLAMLAAYQDVCDGKKEWAVYGYEGKTNTLKLVETGKEDLTEMAQELNSGKCMYAFCRVKEPKTNLHKLVLINWSGEGAPEDRKFACARHVNDVGRFLRGAHVTINARTEDDVDEDVIMEKVSSKASTYNIGKEPKTKESPEHTPVGSVYQRTRADKEIKTSVRDKFWEEAEKEEQRRLQEEKKHRQEEKRALERSIKEREAREAADREAKIKEKMQKVERQRSVEGQAAPRKSQDKLKRTWEDEQKDAAHEEDERQHRADKMKEERAQEAAQLVKRRDSNPRAIFQQIVKENPTVPVKRPPPPRKLRHDFAQVESSVLAGERKKPIEIPRGDPEPVREFTKPAPTQPAQPTHNYVPQQPPRLPTSQPAQNRVEPEPVRRAEPVRQPSPEPVRQPEPEPVRPEPDVISGHSAQRVLMGAGLPARQDSDEEQDEDDDDDWGDEPNYNTVKARPPSYKQQQQQQPPEPEPVKQPEPEPEENIYSEVDQPSPRREEPAGAEDNQTENLYEAPQPYDEPIYQDAEPEEPEVDENEGVQHADVPPKGFSCVALYDYQAEDDGEITFDPDDVITNVDPIDAGWWVGTAPDGRTGMFPANYVEIITQ